MKILAIFHLFSIFQLFFNEHGILLQWHQCFFFKKKYSSADTKQGVLQSCQALGRGMSSSPGAWPALDSLIFLTISNVYDSWWRWNTRNKENTVERERALNQQPKLKSQLNYLWALWSWTIYLTQQSLGSPSAKWCWWCSTSRRSWRINDII